MEIKLGDSSIFSALPLLSEKTKDIYVSDENREIKGVQLSANNDEINSSLTLTESQLKAGLNYTRSGASVSLGGGNDGAGGKIHFNLLKKDDSSIPFQGSIRSNDTSYSLAIGYNRLIEKFRGIVKTTLFIDRNNYFQKAGAGIGYDGKNLEFGASYASGSGEREVSRNQTGSTASSITYDITKERTYEHEIGVSVKSLVKPLKSNLMLGFQYLKGKSSDAIGTAFSSRTYLAKKWSLDADVNYTNNGQWALRGYLTYHYDKTPEITIDSDNGSLSEILPHNEFIRAEKITERITETSSVQGVSAVTASAPSGTGTTVRFNVSGVTQAAQVYVKGDITSISGSSAKAYALQKTTSAISLSGVKYLDIVIDSSSYGTKTITLVFIDKNGRESSSTYTYNYQQPAPTTTTTTTTTPATDATPDAFDIPNKTGVTPGATATTDAITVSGINTSVTAATTLGTIVKNGSDTGAASATVSSGDTIAIRATASSSYNATSSGTATIDGVTDTFSISTTVDLTAPNKVGAVPNQNVAQGRQVLNFTFTLNDSTSGVNLVTILAAGFSIEDLLIGDGVSATRSIDSLVSKTNNGDGTVTVVINYTGATNAFNTPNYRIKLNNVADNAGNAMPTTTIVQGNVL
ncbi:MAG: hypothetical protein HY096_01315 [Nitrospinae bacterium]|nr:hypothetical protein [Nitrospinota bacterium]